MKNTYISIITKKIIAKNIRFKLGLDQVFIVTLGQFSIIHQVINTYIKFRYIVPYSNTPEHITYV